MRKIRRTGRARSAAPEGEAERDRLVLSLCHEVGNLLAGIRLSAHLLARTGRGEESGAREIEDLAAHAGVLLAQVRPLLDAAASPPLRVAPGSVLEAMERSIAGTPLAGTLHVGSAAGLPDVAADPDALLHALLALVRAAREDAGDDQRIVVSAERAGRRVGFSVRERALGAPEPAAKPGALRRGRDLALAIARETARQAKGAVQVRAGKDTREVVLLLPTVSAAGGGATPRAARATARPAPGRAARGGPRRGRASRGPGGRSR